MTAAGARDKAIPPCEAVAMIHHARAASLLALLLVGGCAGVAAIDSGRQLQAYVDCNAAASRRLAGSAGDPVDLAVAAEASCRDRLAALARTYQRTVGAEQARQLIASVKSGALGSNAATIMMGGG